MEYLRKKVDALETAGSRGSNFNMPSSGADTTIDVICFDLYFFWKDPKHFQNLIDYFRTISYKYKLVKVYRKERSDSAYSKQIVRGFLYLRKNWEDPTKHFFWNNQPPESWFEMWNIWRDTSSVINWTWDFETDYWRHDPDYPYRCIFRGYREDECTERIEWIDVSLFSEDTNTIENNYFNVIEGTKSVSINKNHEDYKCTNIFLISLILLILIKFIHPYNNFLYSITSSIQNFDQKLVLQKHQQILHKILYL